ncbi:prolow-density lipoprotein receptor-related protein 1 [Lingula anatina]|uniref:Prolow-density lipoprotein receptor-related protein 1 n=1 Tax=Lingula anatina TaxID=7574 RepID=A0A1S3HIJ3_LINAN|nr:prolow-density lipoprotein receptor-related protein 1 [Lingula anatina]|eukprot:XP_013385940.1 prolow-density lipoprotein receptor-related protein 1 [Lingula anatina]
MRVVKMDVTVLYVLSLCTVIFTVLHEELCSATLTNSTKDNDIMRSGNDTLLTTNITSENSTVFFPVSSLPSTSNLTETTPHLNESTVESCERDYFQCGNGRCVLLVDRCDEFDDCGDQSDEVKCHMPWDKTNVITWPSTLGITFAVVAVGFVLAAVGAMVFVNKRESTVRYQQLNTTRLFC